MTIEEGTKFMVMAPIVRGRKGEYGKLLEQMRLEGYSRVLVDGELRRLDEEIVLDKKYKHDISVVVDRLVMKPDLRRRLSESVEAAAGLAAGLIEVELVDGESRAASSRSSSPASTAAPRSPSSSRGSSPSTHRTAPANAATASASRK